MILTAPAVILRRCADMRTTLASRDDAILDLAPQLDAMPAHCRGELPPRPGRERPVKVERTSMGWAGWNIGRDNGLLFQDPIEAAQVVIQSYYS